MGMCESLMVSDELKDQIKVNRDIEKTLEKKKTTMLEQSVLLIGPGESGKSTVMKQIRAMSGTYTKSELQERKILILRNLFEFSEMLLDYSREHYFEITEEEIKKYIVMCEELKLSVIQDGQMKPELADTLKTFWNHKAIQEAYGNRNKFHLTDSAGYFFENIDRIKMPGFEPNNQDIVHIRVPTSGVVTADVILKNIKLCVADCGGQRSERKKWYHYFDDSHAVLFVAAISEFDQRLVEDPDVNRMKEAITLFWSVFNGKFFQKSAVILFLNKIDIFREKVKTVQIKDFFPKFEGPNTVEEGSKFFRRQFREGIHASFRKRMYCHETCAISDQVQIIINTVIDTVVQENLKDTGMI
ncbi:CRE-GPA-10 protein [Caenorhabditis remanei]|uniref:CRE-GPA-10 protein n=2 Tax=Caenorhabditis remanei TaxID=31234 RepID=E3LPG8_CAERE|nr:CRE-GPA-10 protein [Caenorhabditis remanei]